MIARKNCNSLLKTDNKNCDAITSLNQSNMYRTTKRQMHILCKMFTEQSNKYNPLKTVEIIDSYINRNDKLDRILYSEISNYFFGLSTTKRGTFSTNVEHLLMYVLDDKNSINDDIRKIVVKIYDHIQLVIYQIENTTNILEKGVLDVKEKLRNDFKGIEREYITILGIFASIVLL